MEERLPGCRRTETMVEIEMSPDRAQADAAVARPQATLAGAFARSGTGLHTGRHANVRVGPAPVGHGIVFRRRLEGGRTVDIPASWRHRESQPLCSALRYEGVLVRTMEHLLAALSALRIDNALVELDADELPIFDGSAVPWCDGIRAAGRSEQDAPCRILRLLRPVAVADGPRSLRIEPAAGLQVSGHIELAYFGVSEWSGAITPESFVREIAPARSFGRYLRAMAGRAYGFAARKPLLQGCSPRSAALLFRGHVIGGLRMPQELVCHRILDAIGDFALADHPITGRVTAVHTCHELNHALVAKLMGDESAWELV